jgi:hypothetical protein
MNSSSDPAGLSAVRSWVQHEVVYVFSFKLPVHSEKSFNLRCFKMPPPALHLIAIAGPWLAIHTS